MLTKTQVQQNIESLEKQGASQNDIQGYLNTLGGQIAPDTTTPAPAGNTKGFWGKALDVAKGVGNFLISNEKNFGNDIGDAIYAPIAADQRVLGRIERGVGLPYLGQGNIDVVKVIHGLLFLPGAACLAPVGCFYVVIVVINYVFA